MNLYGDCPFHVDSKVGFIVFFIIIDLKCWYRILYIEHGRLSGNTKWEFNVPLEFKVFLDKLFWSPTLAQYLWRTVSGAIRETEFPPSTQIYSLLKTFFLIPLRARLHKPDWINLIEKWGGINFFIPWWNFSKFKTWPSYIISSWCMKVPDRKTWSFILLNLFFIEEWSHKASLAKVKNK